MHIVSSFSGYSTPKMELILRKCKNSPKYKYIIDEKYLTDRDLYISFHSFETVSKCTKHVFFLVTLKYVLNVLTLRKILRKVFFSTKSNKFNEESSLSIFKGSLSSYARKICISYSSCHFIK